MLTYGDTSSAIPGATPATKAMNVAMIAGLGFFAYLFAPAKWSSRNKQILAGSVVAAAYLFDKYVTEPALTK